MAGRHVKIRLKSGKTVMLEPFTIMLERDEAGKNSNLVNINTDKIIGALDVKEADALEKKLLTP